MGSVKLVGSTIPFEKSFALSAAMSKGHNRFDLATALIERLADLTAVMTATMLANGLYEFLQIGRRLHYPAGIFLPIAFGFSLLFVLMLEHDGAYNRANSLLRIRETERILRVTAHTFSVVFPISFFLSQMFSRWLVVLTFIFVPLLVIVEKQLVFVLIRSLHSRGYGLRNVLVYGAGHTGRRVFSAIVRSPKLGLNPIAIVDDDERLTGDEIFEYGYKRERSVPVIAGPLTSELIKRRSIGLVVVGIPSFSRTTACRSCSLGIRGRSQRRVCPPALVQFRNVDKLRGHRWCTHRVYGVTRTKEVL